MVSQAPSLFTHRPSRAQAVDAELKDELYRQIGRLKMELEWLKKSAALTVDQRRALVQPDHATLSIARQCALLGLARSSFYYEPVPVDPEELRIMHAIDNQYTRTPIYGVPRMVVVLNAAGFAVGPKRVRRLMRQMDLMPIYPRPRFSQSGPDHRKYPYLLRGLTIDRPGQVWCADITYIRMVEGFLYRVAILDWFSRYIVAWELSNTLDVHFCRKALAQAWAVGTPEIFNTDQGVQFTSRDFTGDLEARGVRVSMDGRGRVFDNNFIERFWRSLKYEDIYVHDYATGPEARREIGRYMAFYNHESYCHTSQCA